MLEEVPETLEEDKFDINRDIVLSYEKLAGNRNLIAGKLNELIRWIKSQLPKSPSIDKEN